MRILIEFFLQDLSRMLPSVNNNIQHFLKRINMKRLFTWFILIVSIVFLVSSCGSDSNVDLRNLDDDDDDDKREATTESGSTTTSAVGSITHTVNNLVSGTTYYWKVTTSDGTTTTDSAVRNFTVE